MLEEIKKLLSRLASQRQLVLYSVFGLFAFILLGRLFVLQIVKGADYQANYDLRIEKKETVAATRGNIYDRNGELLAYNKLAYAVTITDSGNYATVKEHQQSLNEELSEIITNVEGYGDALDFEFGITQDSKGNFSFRDSGTSVDRFRADVYGKAKISELGFDSKLGYSTAEATPEQIMEFLYSEKKFSIDKKYDKFMRYKIAVLRYKIWMNRYQQYVATTLAKNVGQKTVAYIKENSDTLVGADIDEQSIRRYNDADAFASIIGYTGTISPEEYAKRSKEDKTVSINDIVGKAGIEQYMDKQLSGKKGYQKIYADNKGKPIKVTQSKAPVTGQDVYLSMDRKLQRDTYQLLEKEIAGILYSKIMNIKEYHLPSNGSGANIVVPIYDVYFTLINNNLIDMARMSSADATELEHKVSDVFEKRRDKALSGVENQLFGKNASNYDKLNEEYQDYATYIVKQLRSDGILKAEARNEDDEVYKKWMSEKISVRAYLKHCLEKNWVDYTKFATSDELVDTEELYQKLVDYILDRMGKDRSFAKIVYHYGILNDQIKGSWLCAILYDQGILKMDKQKRDGLANGTVSAYNFLKDKVKNMELTPGQLALEPSSGSSVVMDVKTGEILACVSYPGYDNNRLANSVDNNYYAYLTQSFSNPLYNHATQQRTAPGSTFKLVSSTAGLAEGVITTASTITDKGVYEKVSNKPKCWIYPSTHGTINVSEAIRDSCNYFFYEVGWRLAGGDNNYNDSVGIKKIRKYAKMFGLNRKTGVEIEENTPHMATEFPVMAAIGQSDNNYTTISLARYVTAIASSGNVYDLTLLDHTASSKGKVLKNYHPKKVSKVGVLNSEQWSAIHSGMRMVVDDTLDTFDNFPIAVAGKTGTAQQTGHPNHALFVGFAPYEKPKVTIATRIAFGYTSHNAADVSKNILGCYFNVKSSKKMLKGGVDSVGGSNSVTD
ncbi:penicillin-binding protein 2 [Lachnospiraceae bacterium C10]|nr:penicillin-binding protein 2 [Lachnospiraceae bacterium C10]